MPRFTSFVTTALLLAVLTCSSASHAELGVSVLGSYRFGDELAVDNVAVDIDEGAGVAVSLQYFNAGDSSFDLWLSRLETATETEGIRADLQQESIQFGGRKYWRDEPFRPYVGATVGIQRLSPDLRSSERETRPAFTLFFGLALPISEQWQLVAEARWLATIFNSDTSIRCDEQDCIWEIKSGTWTQYDIGFGVSGQF